MPLQKSAVLLLLLLRACAPAHAQAGLTPEALLEGVEQYHPDMLRAANLGRNGSLGLMGAKGNFDPKLYAGHEQKTFDGKNYYTLSEAGAKLPTRFGTSFKFEFNGASGINLNSADKLPPGGLMSAGISQPLWQGLLFDEARAELRLARQNLEAFSAEQALMRNDLRFEATQVYWKWIFAGLQREIYRKALETAQARFNNIRLSWELGERMAMDTLESWIQVQDRQIMLADAEMEWQAAGNKLNNWRWNAAGTPELPDNNNWRNNLPPQAFSADSLEIARQIGAHPAQRWYDAKLARLGTERRLKLEKRKPKLNVQYNLLGYADQFPVFLTDNVKWGVNFSAPLLFRSERAELALADLKINNTQLEQAAKMRELENKLRTAVAAYENARQQWLLQFQTLNNYEQLLEMENTRFELGESTFFLINAREMKVIETSVKLAKWQTETRIQEAALRWAAGNL